VYAEERQQAIASLVINKGRASDRRGDRMIMNHPMKMKEKSTMGTSRSTMGSTWARAKVTGVAISAGVVLTMGALTAALSGPEAHAVTGAINGAGNISTQATPPPTPQTPMAKPTQTAKAWSGKGWPWS
jgi:hypothetical protein